MKMKKLLSIFIVIAICFSSLTVLANDDSKEPILILSAPVDETIDYSDVSNWAYWNEGKEKQADLFFVCPTVDIGKDGNFLADIKNEKYRNSFIGAINMELGIYNEAASVYAPFYRQATFPVYSLAKEEQEKYLSAAYEDVKNAFICYAEQADMEKPLILAGFSQGADMVIRLMKDLFDEPEFKNRLVAAYCIGWKLTEDEITEYPHLKPAVSETDTGVIISFNSESEDIKTSLIVGENEKTYSINPLNWKTTSEKADSALNKGACFTDYSGKVNEEIPELTGAYIDEKRGTLKVTDINPEHYPGKLFDNGIYHLYDYQFFFRNLQENVNTRLSSFNAENSDKIRVYYNEKILNFDVEPIIDNGRTLVPFRKIFETMGCSVGYAVTEGKQLVSARRGNNNLLITIGENKMHFNGKEIELDVPAKIKEGRTLVPLRAITEAFKYNVLWNGENKTIHISSVEEEHVVNAEKLSENVTDDNGNVLIEAVAYYPVIENTSGVSFIDEINSEYKLNAEKFINEAKAKKEDAVSLRDAMGSENFTPFVFELTFEQTYNAGEYVSFTNYKNINVGSIHPATIMESKSFSIELESELSVSDFIDEKQLDVSLSKYVINLFTDKLKELDPESAESYTYEYMLDYIGDVQFYITENSVVIYLNQGEALPYALGVISVEIPYNR